MGEIWPTTRIDLDNVTKAILDACNGIVYKDDAQIVRLHAVKQYAITPGVSVKIESVQERV
jgi:Holliday junction resolvase RusA-like endonuclease